RRRCKAKRNPDRAAHYVRAGDQPQDSEIDWPHCAAVRARARRRGDRIRLPMSAIGTKRTCRVAPHMSAFGGKADIMRTCRDCRPSGPDLTLAWFEDQSEDTRLLSCVSSGR